MGFERRFKLLFIAGLLLSIQLPVTIAIGTICVRPTSDLRSYRDAFQACSENHTLEDLATRSAIKSNSQLLFLSGNHSLSTSLLIQKKINLSLIGLDNEVNISCQDAGFKFENVSKLVLKKLRFIKCAVDFTSEHSNGTASLVILDGCCLNLSSIVITEGLGAGIFISNVKNLTFISHLTITRTRNQMIGNQIAYVNSSASSDYNLMLQNSNFIENRCNNETRHESAGLTVCVSKGYAKVSVVGSHFIENCGNLAFILTNITNILAMEVNVKHTSIERGRANKGGGLHVFITKKISNSAPYSQNLSQAFSATTIENVTFTGNVATILGAAFYIQLKASTQTAMIYHNIRLINCSFFNNSLSQPNRGGIAIHSNFFGIDDYLFQFNPQYQIHLRDCHFHNHSILSNDIVTWENTSGNSVLFINTNDYLELYNVNITHNSVNAITAINSNLIFKHRVVLSYNKGSSGGALLLCQDSVMYLAPNTTVDIFNNTAKHAGGGICVEPHCIQSMPKCFFQVNTVISNSEVNYTKVLNSIHVNIYNNTAAYGGSNLFGGDVDFCYIIDRPDWNIAPFNTTVAYETIFNIPSNDSSSVTSRPRQVCFCENGKVDCSIENKTVKSYPGESINITAVLIGQVMGTVPGIVQTWSSNGIEFDGRVQNITHKCSDLNYTFFSSNGTTKQKINFTLGVQQMGDHSGSERLWQFRKKKLIVELRECPIGFKLLSASNHDSNRNRYTCANCILQYEDLECNVMPNTQHRSWASGHERTKISIRRKKFGNTWIGFEYINKTTYFPSSIKHIVNCPFDYCNRLQGVSVRMDQRYYKSNKICDNNRTGRACGACKEEHSTLLGSSKCGKCTNYYLILVVVFAIAGLALVAMLTFLNLTISEGTLSGLIFYANVVEYNSAYVLPHEKSPHALPTPIFRVFVAWINLDLGIETCFYDGMDGYAEAWLEFAFPLYIWSIAIAIIILSNRFPMVATVASRNAVRVLATLVLLSYTKFTRAIINTFSYMDIYSLRGNRSNGTTERVWLIDANLKYFEFKHSLLFAVALLFGVICLPFALTLLFIKQLQRFSHKKPLQWLETLKPFLDAYTGPYTDNGRFWPGLLLMARICLSITGGVNTLSNKKVVQSVTSLVIIILLGFAVLVRPGLYVSQKLDALEYFFLLNLVILLIGTAFCDGVYGHQKAVYDITVGLAFFVFILIVLHHLWLKIRRYSCTLQFAGWLRERQEHLSSSLRASNTTGTQSMNNFPPYVVFNQEREPLLAD